MCKVYFSYVCKKIPNVLFGTLQPFNMKRKVRYLSLLGFDFQYIDLKRFFKTHILVKHTLLHFSILLHNFLVENVVY